MNLLEKYSKRLSYSKGVYTRTHNGEALSEAKQITIAKVLENTANFLNESFSNSVGTQRADMGLFKKFTLDLTTVALPNLIASELVIVKPMSSMSGYIQYIKFVAGSNKGGVKQGELFNDPFQLGEMTESRAAYTSSAVVEPVASGETEVILAWTPVDGKVKAIDENGVATELTAEDNKVTVPAGTIKVAYLYDNIVIPQNDLPILNAKMDAIPLQAKARRIAIYYSQMAAFQAKTETGMDLNKALATQACAELSYEIDTEVIKLLDSLAGKAHEECVFNKRLPVGVGKLDHYAGFAEVLARANQVVYDRTQKYGINWLVVSSSCLPVINLVPGWKAAGNVKMSGPYYAGELNGVKVFVSPAITAGRFIAGYNGDDLMTSAAIYAPYMAIVPTQLLGFADGGMSQGFSTLYDLKPLNDCLVVAGAIVDEEESGAIKVVRG